MLLSSYSGEKGLFKIKTRSDFNKFNGIKIEIFNINIKGIFKYGNHENAKANNVGFMP